MKSFLIYLFHWYLSYITTVPTVHHPTKLQYPHFELVFANFAAAVIASFFLNDIPQFIRTKHRENIQKSTFTLVPCSIPMIPYFFYNLLSYFVIFASLFPSLFSQISSSLLYLAFKGHNISLSRRATLLSLQYSM